MTFSTDEIVQHQIVIVGLVLNLIVPSIARLQGYLVISRLLVLHLAASILKVL